MEAMASVRSSGIDQRGNRAAWPASMFQPGCQFCPWTLGHISPLETPGHPDTFLGATGHPDTCVCVSGCPNVQVSGWILLGRVSIFLPWSLRVGGGVHVSMCPCVSRRHFKVSRVIVSVSLSSFLLSDHPVALCPCGSVSLSPMITMSTSPFSRC